MTLPFMGGLLVCVYLQAAHLVILMTHFAKVSDPYLIFYDFFKNTRYNMPGAELLPLP